MREVAVADFGESRIPSLACRGAGFRLMHADGALDPGGNQVLPSPRIYSSYMKAASSINIKSDYKAFSMILT